MSQFINIFFIKIYSKKKLKQTASLMRMIHKMQMKIHNVPKSNDVYMYRTVKSLMRTGTATETFNFVFTHIRL